MRKIVYVFLAFSMTLSFTACGKSTVVEAPATTETTIEAESSSVAETTTVTEETNANTETTMTEEPTDIAVSFSEKDIPVCGKNWIVQKTQKSDIMRICLMYHI